MSARVPLGSSNIRSHYSRLKHCSGNAVHIPLLASSLVGARITVVPHSNTRLLKQCSTKVFNLSLQYFLMGPTLGAKVCHQL